MGKGFPFFVEPRIKLIAAVEVSLRRIVNELSQSMPVRVGQSPIRQDNVILDNEIEAHRLSAFSSLIRALASRVIVKR